MSSGFRLCGNCVNEFLAFTRICIPVMAAVFFRLQWYWNLPTLTGNGPPYFKGTPWRRPPDSSSTSGNLRSTRY